MIDILLVLLVFFMSISSTEILQTNDNVKLPIAKDAKTKENNVAVGQTIVNVLWSPINNVGTIDVDASDPLLLRADATVRDLMDASLGRPLRVKDASPVYDAPADLDFAKALEKAPIRIRVAMSADETAAKCNWLVPESDEDTLCRSCRLNRTIPVLDDPDNCRWWRLIAGRWVAVARGS